MIGPFAYDWPNEEGREDMVLQFAQKLGLQRRDVRDIQIKMYGKLGKNAMIEFRNPAIAQYAFSQFFSYHVKKGISVADPWGNDHPLFLQPKDPPITQDRLKLQRSVVALLMKHYENNQWNTYSIAKTWKSPYKTFLNEDLITLVVFDDNAGWAFTLQMRTSRHS